MLMGLPWWRSGWESACQCRGHGFEPWSGKIPHAAEQLGPWATTTEPARLAPVLRNQRGHNSERPAHRDEEWPPLAATRESPRTETKTQHSNQSINQSIFKKQNKQKKPLCSVFGGTELGHTPSTLKAGLHLLCTWYGVTQERCTEHFSEARDWWQWLPPSLGGSVSLWPWW